MSAAARRKPSTALAVHDGDNKTPDLSDSRTVMQLIGMAAQNKNVDIDKAERLLTIFERIKANEAKAAYSDALVRLKPNLPIITKRGVIEIREKNKATGERTGKLLQSTPFAKWEDVDEALTPILKEHGFVLTHRSGDMPDGKVKITAVLTHQGGYSEDISSLALPFDTTGSKNNVQAIGSSTSYGRRYTTILGLNIRTKGEDDDGRAAGLGDRVSGSISEAETEDLVKLMNDAKLPLDKFCSAFQVEAVADLPTSRLQDAKDRIEQFKKRGFQKKDKQKETASG